jgi:hypothetical protein
MTSFALILTVKNRIGTFDFSWANIVPIDKQVALQPYIVGGLGCYAITKKHNLRGVEDAALAIGSAWRSALGSDSKSAPKL